MRMEMRRQKAVISSLISSELMPQTNKMSAMTARTTRNLKKPGSFFRAWKIVAKIPIAVEMTTGKTLAEYWQKDVCV
jgi:hypothetical protein